ncbi:hypothetical protein [Streptomyces noursei]|uniref:hypothetical protein n=1 Tax=Streptomyces noursei TaxID=1971 RepID=UPI0011AF951D|nr:hypothetical protein [Streptomyces noursei]
MSGRTKTTVEGYLSSDPQLRFTPKKTPAARILIVTPRRQLDRQSHRWVPDEAQLTLGTARGQLALDICEVLRDRTPVTVTGYLTGSEDGYLELDLTDVAISLRNGVKDPKTVQAEPSYDVRRLTLTTPRQQPTRPVDASPSPVAIPPRPTNPPQVAPQSPFPLAKSTAATNPNWLFKVCDDLRIPAGKT